VAEAHDPPARLERVAHPALGVAVVFVALGWRDPCARAAILTVGTVVCIAASKAGDISQDLKTGYLVGATPARQQAGQFIGAAFACWAVAGTVLLLGSQYTFGSKELGAPQVEVAEQLEQVALKALQERHPERVLATNVEYYSAIVLDVAEIPPPLAPAMFACSRVAGWSAHILEQKRTGRLFRPSARYVGPGTRSASSVVGAAVRT